MWIGDNEREVTFSLVHFFYKILTKNGKSQLPFLSHQLRKVIELIIFF